MRALGLMSGTSLDGIDAAVIELEPRAAGYAIRLERFAMVPFADGLRDRLAHALPPHPGSASEVNALHAALGAAFAAAARDVLAGEPVDFAASHGLTLFHDGARAATLQVGRPYELRDATCASVVWDFRSADCALGGHGAPLVPYVDALVLGSPDEDRVAVNFGGICNLTVLPRGAAPGDAIGFDCGPGVMLLDAFVRGRTGEAFDRDGAYALAGNVDEPLVSRLLRDPFFAQPPPKSTGRERFGAALLETERDAFARLGLEDGCATLAALTVRPLAAAIRTYGSQRARIVAGGGGAHNQALLEGLRRELPGAAVELSGGYGLDPDAKEAIAFAVLGYETLRGRPANLPRVTGARAPAVLGSIVPHELPRLLAKVEREVRRCG